MSSKQFLACHAITAAWEGGWSNHPSDPGGKTMYGVTEAKWLEYCRAKKRPVTPIQKITRQQAEELYYDEFWLKARCQTLASGVDLATYDASVNSGVSRGRKWLEASLGGADHETVKKICAKRLGFMQSLAIWKTFGKGWARRVADIEAKGVAWALAATKSASDVRDHLNVESKNASQKASKHTNGATTGAAGTTGGIILTPETADQIAGFVLGGLLTAGLVITLIFMSRAIINNRRANAYAEQAGSQ